MERLCSEFEEKQTAACLKALCVAGDWANAARDIEKAKKMIQNYYFDPTGALRTDRFLRITYPAIEWLEKIEGTDHLDLSLDFLYGDPEIIKRLNSDIAGIKATVFLKREALIEV